MYRMVTTERGVREGSEYCYTIYFACYHLWIVVHSHTIYFSCITYFHFSVYVISSSKASVLLLYEMCFYVKEAIGFKMERMDQ